MLKLGTSEPSKHQIMESAMIDFQPPEKLSTKKPPRVFTTHLPASRLPQSIKTKGCKLISLSRDPRAVAVSFYHHLTSMRICSFHGDWSDFLYFFSNGYLPLGSWVNHRKDWASFAEKNERNQLHFIQYEDLIANPLQEITKLSNFLGESHSQQLLSSIAETTAFEALKDAKEGIWRKAFGRAFEGTKPSPMYRKGKVDDWRSYFTVEQNDRFMKFINDAFKGSGARLKSPL